MVPRFHRLAISDVRRETPEAISIAFSVPGDLRAAYAFTSGQHLTLRITVGGEEVRRSYSICSGIDDGELRVAIKRLEDGLFSCFANEHLKLGDAIDVMTPMGRFGIVPDPQAARTYVAFAAGSGITPVLSIIKTVLGREPKSRFTLCYGNRSSSSIIFKSAIDDLKDAFVDRFSVHHILSREMQDVALLHGRLDGNKVAALMRTVGPATMVDHAFLCGPLGMIEEASGALKGLGVPESRIHAEIFTPEGGVPAASRPSPRKERETQGARLSLRLDGATHRITMHTDETVLEAALRSGLDLPYSCRGGMCCTCRAKLAKGRATMDQNFSLEPWELKAGFVLTCQCRPTTPSLEIDFDAV